MRTYTTSGIIFGYPDRICFQFNPCICTAAGTGLAYTETVCGGYTLRTEAYGGSARWDMREMIQIAARNYLSTEWRTDWEVVYRINAYNSAGIKLAGASFSSFAVFGALRRGESWNGVRRMAYFPGYPFYFQLYLDGRVGKLLIKNDRRPDAVIDTSSEQGIFPYILPNSPQPAKERYEVYDFQGTLTQVTFDNTFDLTFRYRFNGTMTKVLEIDVIDSVCERPVYLRWVDRHGFVCYWLFKEISRQSEVAEAREYQRDNLREVEYDHWLTQGGERQVAWQRQDVLECCAPMLDRVQWDVVQGVATSPFVDRWDPKTGNWSPVTIKAGTYTKGAEELQDFVCNVVEREYDLQAL